MYSLLSDKKILIIDDDEDDFLITKDFIKSVPGNSFVIDWCSKYSEGLRLLLSHSYDLYIVDYRLGSKTGVDFLKDALRNNCDEPIILLTGKGSHNIDIKSMQLGAVDYLVKSELTVEKMERSLRYALERTITLKALRFNEKKFRSIFENSKDVIFITDYFLNFQDVNPAIKNLLGYDRKEMISMFLYDILVQENHKIQLSVFLEQKKDVNDWEVVLITKYGDKKHCILSLTFDIENRYMQGIFHDITNIKKIERATLRGEKLAATERIVRTIAHEIRNPLNNITLSVEQMKSELADEHLSLYMDIIQRNSRRINALIAELLNKSRPNANTSEVVSLQLVIEDVIGAAIDRLTLKNINLHLSIPESHYEIVADRNNLKMALLNIVINAIESMEGQIRNLQITITKETDRVLLSISDSGCGIPEENLVHLFEPFFTQKRNGIGLGLTFTHNILQVHNAGIEVTSKFGQGTNFTISFPMAQEK